MVPYTFNSGTKEEEMGVSSWVQGQPGQQSEIPSQERENEGWGGGGGRKKKRRGGGLLENPLTQTLYSP